MVKHIFRFDLITILFRLRLKVRGVALRCSIVSIRSRNSAKSSASSTWGKHQEQVGKKDGLFWSSFKFVCQKNCRNYWHFGNIHSEVSNCIDNANRDGVWVLVICFHSLKSLMLVWTIFLIKAYYLSFSRKCLDRERGFSRTEGRRPVMMKRK